MTSKFHAIALRIYPDYGKQRHYSIKLSAFWIPAT
jgi:hypothetical protein